MTKLCTIEGCGRPLMARGMCKVHYERNRRHGNPNTCLHPMSKRGAPLKWIKEHATHRGGDCLIWPFARHPNGHAHISLYHGTSRACRIMCEEAHGPPPSEIHQAAHSCGNDHLGCIHPEHLRWATPVENAADKIEHGTLVFGSNHYASKLTEDDVREIRALRGKVRGDELARKYDVFPSCISKIQNGQRWKHVQ